MLLGVYLPYNYHKLFKIISLRKYETLKKIYIYLLKIIDARIEYNTILLDVKFKSNMKQVQTPLHYVG